MDNQIDEKKAFIDAIALRSAVNAATQTRSRQYHVYSDLIIEHPRDSREEKKLKWIRKQNVVSFWKTKLKEYASSYKTQKKEMEEFIEDVKKLKKDINDHLDENNKVFKQLFYGDNGIRIAQCQKSLSVYLKWLWCLGDIEYEPPVCPIDRNVLNLCYSKLDRRTGRDDRAFIKQINDRGGWGQIDVLDDYSQLLKIAKEVSKSQGLSMAEWELRAFNSVLDDGEENV